MAEHSQDTSSGPSLEEERPFTVETFTARYDPIEDRMCLNAVDAAGVKQAIYLTRRLMDQIIPVVAKHLEEKTPKGVSAEVLQSMSQERVRHVRKSGRPLDPVLTDHETPRWLCTTIQVQKQPTGLALTLIGGKSCAAHVPLADPHLRTMLDIFCASYAKARWDLYVFPDWLGPEQGSVGQGAQVRLN